MVVSNETFVNPPAAFHVYVDAPPAVIWVELPIHNDGDAGVTVNVGEGFTVINAVCVAVHPFTSVPVTVYVVVPGGLAFGFPQLVQLSPVAGNHVYVVAPEVNRLTLSPGQIFTAIGVIVTVGLGFTSIVMVALSLHPPLAPITVYVVVSVGIAITDVPDEELSDDAGFHV